MAKKQTRRASAIDSSEGSAWRESKPSADAASRLRIGPRGALVRPRLGAHHQPADSLLLELRALQVSGDPPLENGIEAIREGEDLLEVERDEKDSGPLLPRLQQS